MILTGSWSFSGFKINYQAEICIGIRIHENRMKIMTNQPDNNIHPVYNNVESGHITVCIGNRTVAIALLRSVSRPHYVIVLFFVLCLNNNVLRPA